MKLTLLEKTKQELISLAEAKNYIRIDQNCDDNLIDTFISATREAMESILQKSIIKQKWMYQVDAKDINYIELEAKNLSDISSTKAKIPLPRPPVITIEKITINYKNGRSKILEDFEEKSDHQFYVLINREEIRPSVKNIEIIYCAGIAENPENVPYQLKLANLMLVANAYKNRFTYDSSELMPKSIEKLLAPFKPALRLL